ncbi:MAG: asparaginase [Kordiimonadaceae bacterium]|jgi:N4-(beta-N-acetylglucosaminyl)-L-asparaginase|nr:asparaginase [Kordiimonadaceae bacterium]MBT6036593.1 asparaginase [Kordiimonadaceae bacterium]MBT6328399.1 asparaginase [Kordiimonadaceae bacterium]MBT7583546.1 asparaginase [Kordiimonadaceae bacterium]
MKRRNFLKSSVATAALAMTAGKSMAQSGNPKDDNMMLLTNATGAPGIDTTVNHLKNGMYGIDAMIEGINFVEADPTIRSVGLGGWPNLLGVMEFDGGVMDGTTREVGSVGALKHTYHASQVARAVMQKLNHVMVTGDGADRLAAEIGLPKVNTLLEDSGRVWKAKIKEILTPEEFEKFPNIPLAPLNSVITDPEKVRDTTVFMCKDSSQSIHAATSTSGWGWKYPGRLGDSPIVGAGFYADTRYGAAACTHTGEMAIRCSTSRSIVMAMQMGRSLEDAVKFAVDEVASLKEGFIAGLVIHAIDAKGGHKVVSYNLDAPGKYWLWKPSMSAPELRDSEMV